MFFRPEECAPATNKKPQASAVTLIWSLTNILLNLSKCKKSLEERNQLHKLPVPLRGLLDFWKESHHKQITTQKSLCSLIKSIQEESSKAVMASGGVLATLRSSLIECLPVLENHQEYLTSMANRKQKQRERSEAATAVDCVVQDVGER